MVQNLTAIKFLILKLFFFYFFLRSLFFKKDWDSTKWRLYGLRRSKMWFFESKVIIRNCYFEKEFYFEYWHVLKVPLQKMTSCKNLAHIWHVQNSWFKIRPVVQKVIQNLNLLRKTVSKNVSSQKITSSESCFSRQHKNASCDAFTVYIDPKDWFFESKFSNIFEPSKNNFTSKSNAWWEIRLKNWRVLNVRRKVWHAVDFRILSLMNLRETIKIDFFSNSGSKYVFLQVFHLRFLLFKTARKS